MGSFVATKRRVGMAAMRCFRNSSDGDRFPGLIGEAAMSPYQPDMNSPAEAHTQQQTAYTAMWRALLEQNQMPPLLLTPPQQNQPSSTEEIQEK